MQTPKFSIITPVFNNEKDIEQCLKSVAAQTYTNIEHILIDGNSNDNTLNIISAYSNKYSHIK
ncbi:MAG TPA: glycosyltransferase, partial [Chitinophagales bacterium]|nr:glycosyltransferase [Chitinophagales bacterium]